MGSAPVPAMNNLGSLETFNATYIMLRITLMFKLCPSYQQQTIPTTLTTVHASTQCGASHLSHFGHAPDSWNTLRMGKLNIIRNSIGPMQPFIKDPPYLPLAIFLMFNDVTYLRVQLCYVGIQLLHPLFPGNNCISEQKYQWCNSQEESVKSFPSPRSNHNSNLNQLINGRTQ